MEPKPMSPKPLTPEEIAIIRSYATEIGCYEVNTLGLLSHIDALQAENERLRAALREFRTAFDDYQGSEGCTCCEKSDHTVHAETMARLMKEPEA